MVLRHLRNYKKTEMENVSKHSTPVVPEMQVTKAGLVI